MPWRRNLGGARVQLELAEELRSLGHDVEKYSWEDAFPRGLPRLLPGQIALFARRAKWFIRANGDCFDVIDAHQGNVLGNKRSLGFDGTLVVRSVGLIHFYEAWERNVQPANPSLRSRLGKWFRAADYTVLRRAAERSFDMADLILLPNDDETAFVSANRRWSHKARTVPLAMSVATWCSLSSIVPARLPVDAGQIVFLGSWGARKGGRDWRAIINHVWEKRPNARFLFLGTGTDKSVILSDLGAEGDLRVKVVPAFDPIELPRLLAGTNVGAFPSYAEGLPLGVLEQLAAGIGVVAYDIPGPRQLLDPLAQNLLVEPGDTAAMAERLVALLTADAEDVAKLSTACRDFASHYTWAIVAGQTLDAYRLSGIEAP